MDTDQFLIIMNKLDALHGDFREFKGEIGARVKNVEEEQDKADTRQWYHSIIVTGIGVVHHSLASLFNWKI